MPRNTPSEIPATARVRLDKWLWAARFFRTRAQAKQAIDAGRVNVNGARAKPAREIDVGCELMVKRGDDEFTLIVVALSDERRGAPEAQRLYAETSESVLRREQQSKNRRVASFGMIAPPNRPTKKDRRELDRWRQRQEEDTP